MFKLVLGIVVVGILQFGFVIYSSLQEPVDLALAPVQTADAIPFPENDLFEPFVAYGDGQDEEVSASSGPVNARSSYTSASVPARSRSYKRRSANYYSAPSIPSALPGDFSTIVISYGGSSAPHTTRRPCDPPEPDRPKQRTAFAKAEPAAIRPWQVITTFDTRKN